MKTNKVIGFFWILAVAVAALNTGCTGSTQSADNFVQSEKQRHFQQKLTALFKAFLAIAEEKGLEYWISSGTLLGAVRHKNIIPWDDDIDVDVPSSTIVKLKELADYLASKGFKLAYSDHIYRFESAEEPGNKDATKSPTPYIDLFEVKKGSNDNEAGRWVYQEDFNSKRWPNAYFHDREIFPLREYVFGELKVKGPKDPYPYLNRQYGDWKNPVIEKGHHN